jgi:hypothetical protein
MIARKYKARVPAPEPHLIREAKYHRCSACGYPFAADIHPSLNAAFAEHLINSHQPGQKKPEDASQVALHAVPEATENK